MRYLIFLSLSSALVFGEAVASQHLGANTSIVRDRDQSLKEMRSKSTMQRLNRRSPGKDDKKPTSQRPLVSRPKEQRSSKDSSEMRDLMISRQELPRPSRNVPPTVHKVVTFNVESVRHRPGSKSASGSASDQAYPEAMREFNRHAVSEFKETCQRARDGACRIVRKVADAIVSAAKGGGPPPGTNW